MSQSWFRRNRLSVLHRWLLVLIMLVGACSQKHPVDSIDSKSVSVSQAGYNKAVPSSEYRIQLEDQLDVKFFFNSELNEEKIPVRPDGRISLQLVGEVMAAGRTPGELSAILRKLYDAELKKPDVVVIVRSFAQQWAYVDGEVLKPAQVELRGAMTALQAIASVGGVKDVGELEEVLVLRRGSENKPIVFRINLREMLEGTATQDQDVRLLPYDIVYVSRSGIGDVNRFVDLYIRKNIPITFGLFWNPFL